MRERREKEREREREREERRDMCIWKLALLINIKIGSLFLLRAAPFGGPSKNYSLMRLKSQACKDIVAVHAPFPLYTVRGCSLLMGF